jgi:hypothetical protein
LDLCRRLPACRKEKLIAATAPRAHASPAAPAAFSVASPELPEPKSGKQHHQEIKYLLA